MPWAVRLAAGAEQDLAGIAAWTAEQFGPRQAEAYIATLLEGLRLLSVGPTALGTRSRPELAPGMRSLAVSRTRHVFLFRCHDEERAIDILRILHAAMDPTLHLGTP